MPPAPRFVALPAYGVWRVGWATSPLHSRSVRPLDLADTDAGNRFDAIAGEFTTSYCGTTRAACYAETLAHRRPKAALVKLVKDGGDWSAFMAPGTVEAEWRRKRVLVRSSAAPGRRYLDLHDHRTLAWLNREFRSVLTLAGVDELTLDSVTKGDRVLTRYIASWVHKLEIDDEEPLVDGIRYLSRHGADLECWAIFDRAELKLEATKTIDRDDPDLQRIAALFGLEVF